MVDRNDGEVDPVALVLALLERASASRARIFEASPVRGFEREGTDWRISTPSGTVRARQVVFCTNAWSGRILPAANPAAGQSPGEIGAEHVLDQQYLAGLVEQGSHHPDVLPGNQ